MNNQSSTQSSDRLHNLVHNPVQCLDMAMLLLYASISKLYRTPHICYWKTSVIAVPWLAVGLELWFQIKMPQWLVVTRLLPIVLLKVACKSVLGLQEAQE